ncbi:hypothetical protein [Acinetobacter sp. YH12072]|uniref:hypothetical protein n=1 Tax=Acinetobacter sp. YH12072 TaxID=2601068 RepID=UPI00211E374E|nr:hypothetical protein [Acinetobacter sp. YH12072]
MSEFEKWFRSLNANGKTVYFLGNEHKVSEMAWNHQQAIIDDLKAQLNNMEACYIGKKKQVEDQQKRIDAGLEKIHQFGKEGCLFPEWLTWAEKALRGANA